MNEALKMADQLHHHPTQSNADKAAALLRSQAAEIERLKSSSESYIALANTAYEITDTLRAENQKLQERMDEIVSNDDRIIAIQRDEIERLNAKSVHWKKEWTTEAAITDALRAENQKLRKVLESVATMSEELSISRFARAALVDTRIKGEEI